MTDHDEGPAADKTQSCYPFSTELCDNPACSCRRERAEDRCRIAGRRGRRAREQDRKNDLALDEAMAAADADAMLPTAAAEMETT